MLYLLGARQTPHTTELSLRSSSWLKRSPRSKLSRQRRPWMRRPPSPVRLSAVMTVVVRVVAGVTTFLC